MLMLFTRCLNCLYVYVACVVWVLVAGFCLIVLLRSFVFRFCCGAWFLWIDCFV